MKENVTQLFGSRNTSYILSRDLPVDIIHLHFKSVFLFHSCMASVGDLQQNNSPLVNSLSYGSTTCN